MGSLCPGSVRRSPREVSSTGEDAVAAWKGFLAVLQFLAGMAGVPERSAGDAPAQ